MPQFSASEVTTLWHYTNMFIIIIINWMKLVSVMCAKAQLAPMQVNRRQNVVYRVLKHNSTDSMDH